MSRSGIECAKSKPLPSVAFCPVCHRDYVWVPADGGECLWCGVKLVSRQINWCKWKIPGADSDA